MSPESDVTRILADLAGGDRSAVERLLPHVYDELRALAASFFRQRQPNQTRQPTALVHEAFVKLVGSANQNWTSKKRFFGVAAMAMRQLLTDRARRVAAEKRGGGIEHITLAPKCSISPRARSNSTGRWPVRFCGASWARREGDAPVPPPRFGAAGGVSSPFHELRCGR